MKSRMRSSRCQGFTTRRVDQSSDTVPKDTVITQNPNGGQVAVGSQIVLTVSTGPDSTSQIQMPTLAGMTFDQAQEKLQSMGWTGKLNQKSDKLSGQPEGTITGQNPQAGSMINRDQNVTVNVSEGNGLPSFPTSPTRPTN